MIVTFKGEVSFEADDPDDFADFAKAFSAKESPLVTPPNSEEENDELRILQDKLKQMLRTKFNNGSPPSFAFMGYPEFAEKFLKNMGEQPDKSEKKKSSPAGGL